MQTIPIIISEKVLKNFFLEVIDEINKYFTYNYTVIEKKAENSEDSDAIILDIKSLERISSFELSNKKLFIINDNSVNSFEQNNNQVFIDRPFKIIDLFRLVEENVEQVKKRERKKIRFKNHTFDPLVRTIYKGDKSIRLTEKESEIFFSLINNKSKYLSKKFLLQQEWKYRTEIDTHTLETHLYSLRKKIDTSLGTKNLIMYEEKKGYLIDRDLL